jgi:hypothetical protein
VTFGGVSGFDAHRRGGGCLPPGGLGYVVRDDVWRMPVTLERLAQLAALRVTPRAADGPAGIVGTSEPSKINNGDLALTLWGES